MNIFKQNSYCRVYHFWKENEKYNYHIYIKSALVIVSNFSDNKKKSFIHV